MVVPWGWGRAHHKSPEKRYFLQPSQVLACMSGKIVTLHLVGLFVCLFALRPKSTAMVIAGRSVHLTTLFPGQA